MATENKILSEFIENALYRLNENTRMNSIAVQQLTDEEIWKRFNVSSNSVANLILHMCGNMTQYVISSLGEREDVRERDLEFSTISGGSKEEVLQKLFATVRGAIQTIQTTAPQQWLRKREVQGISFSGIGIVLHAVEHYSYHTGQIAFWTKQLKNTDLGFYEGRDLNLKNKA